MTHLEVLFIFTSMGHCDKFNAIGQSSPSVHAMKMFLSACPRYDL